MIFISHRLSSAVDADRIFLIEDGRIKESGSHSELMSMNGSYAEMFKSSGGELYGRIFYMNHTKC